MIKNKNRIKFDGKPFELTEVEKHNITSWVNYKKNSNYKLPTILPISDKVHLDFIGWDNPEFMDVLICKTKGKLHNIKFKIDEK